MPEAQVTAPPVPQAPPVPPSAPQNPSASSDFFRAFGIGDTPTQQTEPVSPAPAATAPQEPAQATPAPATATPEAPNPYLDLIKPPTAPAAWSDDVKALFKARGIEDIDAVLSERETLKAEIELQRKGLEQANALLARENELDEFNKELIRQAREGKNVREWLSKQPNIDLSKPADKQDRIALIKAEFPQAISEQDEKTLMDPDADPEDVAQINKRLDGWHPLAAIKFEERRKAPLELAAKQQAEQKAWGEKFMQSVAANVSALPGSMKTLATPEITQELASGRLIETMFYEADGTLKKTALGDALWLRDREAILKTAKEVAKAEGIEEGRLQVGAKLSDHAGAAREHGADAPTANPFSASDPFFSALGLNKPKT